MPIKGITDTPRLPRLGKIHLGIKVQQPGKAEYPRPTDYFVCPPEVQEVYGQEPRKLDVIFPTNNPDQWASHFYRAYSSYRGLICKGTGETARRLVDLDAAVDKDTGALPVDLHPRAWPIANRNSKNVGYHEICCPPASCPQYLARACKPVMNLQFCLPKVPGLGVYQIDTSSWNSIRNVLAGIELVQLLAGRIDVIPLVLSLVPLQVQPEGTKKTVHILQLTAPYRLADLFRFTALPRGQALLPEPDREMPEDLFLSDDEPLVALPPAEETVLSPPDGTDEPADYARDRSASSKPTRDLATLKQVRDLFFACHEDFGVQPAEVVRVSGYGRAADLEGQNLQEIYRTIEAHKAG